jgi:hypothetical protein
MIDNSTKGLFFILSISVIIITLIYNMSIYPFLEVRGAKVTNGSSYVTIEISPSKSGDVYCNGQKVSDTIKVYGIDTELRCRAVSKNGFMFNSWAGLSFDTSNPIRLKILHNGTLTANFSEDRLTYTAKILSHPFLLLVIGAAITSYVIPLLTRRWQDHQKELELKVDLVSQISESVHRVMIALEPFAFKSPDEIIRSTEPSDKAIMSSYSQAKLDWQLKTEVIKAQIRLYFPNNDFNTKLTGFFTIVQGIHVVAINPYESGRKTVLNSIKDSTIIRDVRTADTIQQRDNIKWNSVAAIHPRSEYEDSWLSLLRMISYLLSELLDDLMKLNISGFSNLKQINLDIIKNTLTRKCS